MPLPPCEPEASVAFFHPESTVPTVVGLVAAVTPRMKMSCFCFAISEYALVTCKGNTGHRVLDLIRRNLSVLCN